MSGTSTVGFNGGSGMCLFDSGLHGKFEGSVILNGHGIPGSGSGLNERLKRTTGTILAVDANLLGCIAGTFPEFKFTVHGTTVGSRHGDELGRGVAAVKGIGIGRPSATGVSVENTLIAVDVLMAGGTVDFRSRSSQALVGLLLVANPPGSLIVALNGRSIHVARIALARKHARIVLYHSSLGFLPLWLHRLALLLSLHLHFPLIRGRKVVLGWACLLRWRGWHLLLLSYRTTAVIELHGRMQRCPQG